MGIFPPLLRGPRAAARLLRRADRRRDRSACPRADALIAEGDRLRDAADFAAAAATYGAALALVPSRTEIRVQYGNMLKDVGRLGEAEAAYRAALAQAPRDHDIHLQLGHLLKLQGRRDAALECYRRAAELAPSRLDAQRELAAAGDPQSQQRLFEAQLRLGSVAVLMEVAQQLTEMRAALDRIAAALPDIAAQLAFPVSAYDRFRELYGVPAPPAARPLGFAILLLADREALTTLRLQLLAVEAQSTANWTLKVIGRDPARRRIVEAVAERDPRIAWADAAGDGPAVAAAAERRVALASTADWLLFLAPRAMLHPSAIAWFAAVAERTGAAALTADEETVTRERGRNRYSSPQLRHVVDYDTLIEMNAFGETIAVAQTAYAEAAVPATGSPGAARGALLLALARASRVGHIPCALVAREEGAGDGAGPEDAGASHLEAVRAHIAAAGLGERITIAAPSGPLPRLTVRWRPSGGDVRIAVIIPTRDNGADLRICVDSLRNTARRAEALQFVIVDNGSREADARRILDDLAGQSWARVLVIDEAFNWSRLNNRAVAATELPLLLFANDDIEMLSEAWDEVLRGQLDRPEIGAVGGRLLYRDDTVQHAGVLFGWNGATIHDGHYASRGEPGPAARWQVTRSVSAVTGAMLATRRADFLAHGGFDEAAFPVGYSDFDYALKLRAAGLRILWTPDITAYHQESKSRGLDHLDAEKRARNAVEHHLFEARWGGALQGDPSINPLWHRAGLPFRLLAAPSRQRLWRHIEACAAANPWRPPGTRDEAPRFDEGGEENPADNRLFGH